jgi:hypothetical protein
MMDEPSHTDAVMTWHAQGMSFAEIGHRLGVSPDRLREIMAEAGVDPDVMDRPEHDDDGPNKAEVR